MTTHKFLKASAVLEVARRSHLKQKQLVQEATNLLISAGVTAKEFKIFIEGLWESRKQDRVCIEEGCVKGEVWRDWQFLNSVLMVLKKK